MEKWLTRSCLIHHVLSVAANEELENITMIVNVLEALVEMVTLRDIEFT